MTEPTPAMGAGDLPRPMIVERTGIAVVHAGEQIIAEPEAAAQLMPAERADIIRYVFPVEVEIVGDALMDQVFEALRRAFEAIG